MPGTGPQPTPTNPSTASATQVRSPAENLKSPSEVLRSMTGYAQARAVENGWSLRISVRAVNHRFLDLRLRVPEGFEPIEPRIRQLVRERVRRGHLDVTLHYELAGASAIGVNQDVAAAYVQAVNLLRKQFGIETEPDLAAILRLPGVIGPPGASLEEELARLEVVVAQCLLEALDKLDVMREREANLLREEMSGRLGGIATLAAEVETRAERARPAFAKRLEMRLKELLGEAELDLARLAEEAAIAAERSDVS
jgi:uncharacterized protein (TIGR00255 family)